MKTQHAPAATVRTLEHAGHLRALGTRARCAGSRWDGAAWSGWKTVPGGVDSGLAAVADTSVAHPPVRAPRQRRDLERLRRRHRPAERLARLAAPCTRRLRRPRRRLACDPAAGRVTGARPRRSASAGAPRLAGRVAPPRRRAAGGLDAHRVGPRSRRLGPCAPTAGPDGIYSVKLPAGPDADAGSWRPGRRAPPALGLRDRQGPRRAPGSRLKATPPRAPGRHGALPRPPQGPPGAQARQARGAAGVRRRPLAHVRPAALEAATGATARRTGCAGRSGRARSASAARVRREAGYPYELGYSRAGDASQRP